MLPKKQQYTKKTLVLIDYANLLSSARHLNKKIDLEIFYNYLKSLSYIHKVSFYYGTDPRNAKSIKFINWLRKTGYEVVTKEVKYIKVNPIDLIHDGKNKNLFSKLEKSIVKNLEDNIDKLEKKGILLEQPKCNLDIEIALDMMNSIDDYDSFILISGDGDFKRILEIARAEGKYVTVIALRKFLAGELIKNCDHYVNLSSFNSLKGFLYEDKAKAKYTCFKQTKSPS